MFKSHVVARGLALLALVLSGAAKAEEARSQYNMPVGVTEISRQVHDLHMLVLWVVTGIGVLVFGAMLYAIINHRRSKHPKPADFHESTTVEIIWTALPFVILVALAIPAAGTLIKMEDTSNSDLTVKVTGFQWGWKYEYVGSGVEFTSLLAADSNAARQLKSGIDPATIPNYLWEVNNPLVLPTGKKIRFLITSQDVIHAWWVFDLAVKRDAIPGIVNESWTKIDVPGTYRGVCAELCGRDHGFMPVVVQALPEAEFKAWLAKQGGVEVAAAAHAVLPAEAPPTPVIFDIAPAADVAVPGVAKLLFAAGSADLPADAAKTLEALATYAKANPSAVLHISGFHDTSGSAAKNAELAKQRALAVKSMLIEAGVSEAALAMKKPEQVNAGAAEDARRVEVQVVQAGAAESAVTQPADAAPTQPAAVDVAAVGKKVYETNCQACHQASGEGMAPTFPPLKASKVVNGPASAVITQVIKGKNMMPPFAQLSDADVAAVATYIRASWGNQASAVAAADVAAARK